MEDDGLGEHSNSGAWLFGAWCLPAASVALCLIVFAVVLSFHFKINWLTDGATTWQEVETSTAVVTGASKKGKKRERVKRAAVQQWVALAQRVCPSIPVARNSGVQRLRDASFNALLMCRVPPPIVVSNWRRGTEPREPRPNPVMGNSPGRHTFALTWVPREVVVGAGMLRLGPQRYI